jgi:hypothetical protein
LPHTQKRKEKDQQGNKLLDALSISFFFQKENNNNKRSKKYVFLEFIAFEDDIMNLSRIVAWLGFFLDLGRDRRRRGTLYPHFSSEIIDALLQLIYPVAHFIE